MASQASVSSLPLSISEPPTLPSDVTTITVEGCSNAGDELAGRGDHAAAIEQYKRALLLLGSDRGQRRIELYVKVGDQSRALGKTRVAINNYSKALAGDPKHSSAYVRVLELLHSERDFLGIDEIQRKRAEALESASERVELWKANVSLWLDDAAEPARAIAGLDRWLDLEPGDPDALEKLARVCKSLGQHQRAVDALAKLGDALEGERAARVRFEAAKLAEEALADPSRALALCECTLESCPDDEALFTFADRLCAESSAWQRLTSLNERLAERRSTPRGRFEACARAAALARDKLGDLPRAERALCAAHELDDGSVQVLRVLSDVQAEQGALDRALDSCRLSLDLEPRDAEGYQRALGLFERAGVADGALSAALVLDYLGEADINQSLLADAHRPEGLLTPQGVLSDEEWRSALLFPERDAALQRLIEAITPAAIEAKLELLRRAKKSPALDPNKLQDLQASTATLARALQWSARVLGVQAPALYLDADVVGTVLALPAQAPAMLASRALGSGLSPKQLAFIWGRALGVFRPEHYLAAFYASTGELTSLLEVATRVARAESTRSLQGDAKVIATALEQALAGELRERLRENLESVVDASEAASEWLESYELACVRTGLLACGDIAEAAALTERFPFGELTTIEEQVDALLTFSVSGEYIELRRRLGVAVG